MKCCICGAERPNCHVVQITEEEKQAIRRMGQEPRDEYIYCRPCYKLLSNKAAAAKFVQGVVQTRLQMRGNPRAEEIAKKYHDFFLKKAREPLS